MIISIASIEIAIKLIEEELDTLIMLGGRNIESANIRIKVLEGALQEFQFQKVALVNE